MTRFARFMSIVLALVMLMSMTGYAAEKDPVLFTYNGVEHRKSEVDAIIEGCAEQGYITSAYAYDEAIDYLIANKLLPLAKAAELGVDQFTDEELKAIYAEADELFEAQLDAFVDYYSEQADVDKDQLREELRIYWEEMGTTVESARDVHYFNKVKERLLETMTVEVTEEEIQEVYQQQIEKDKSEFNENVLAYEYYSNYLDYDIWYVPDGYRSVQRILLTVDEELIEAYEDADDDEAEAAAQAVVDARAEDVEAIMQRIEAGEDFVELMKEVSEDAHLNDALIADGYYVHAQSTIWGKDFVEAAFSEQMQKVGDIVGPVATEDGVQILYFFDDQVSGPIEINDVIRESITTYLTGVKRSDMMDAWAEEYEVVYEQDAIDKLIKKGKAAAEAAETATVQ